MDQPPAPIRNQQCRRCGTCCCKGGPALHSADRQLVLSGKIALKYLFTIRRGEPAFDNVQRMVAPAPTDIIKIKGQSSIDAACRFLRHDPVVCTIYAHRPLECRVLACWDTRAILEIYAKERLTRIHLLGRLPGLSDLVDEHQQRCNYERIGALAAAIKKEDASHDAAEALLEIIRYDHSLRRVTVERTRLDPELLEFLFGLPLTQTIGRLGLKLLEQGSRAMVVPSCHRPGIRVGRT